MTEGERIEWHHRLNGHEFEQAAGDGEGQGSLARCSPWGCKESDTTEQPNNKKKESWGPILALPLTGCVTQLSLNLITASISPLISKGQVQTVATVQQIREGGGSGDKGGLVKKQY